MLTLVDVVDPVETVAEAEPPIHGDRSTLPRDDSAGHNDPIGADPAAGHDEISVAGLCEPAAVKINEPIREETGKLLLPGRAREPPIRAEHEAAHAGQIEILPNHLTEIGRFRAQRHGRADH
jgi:hypothetical protein